MIHSTTMILNVKSVRIEREPDKDGKTWVRILVRNDLNEDAEFRMLQNADCELTTLPAVLEPQTTPLTEQP